MNLKRGKPLESRCENQDEIFKQCSLSLSAEKDMKAYEGIIDQRSCTKLKHFF